MTVFQMIRGGVILPIAWIIALTCRRSDADGRFHVAQKWSNRILRIIGYRLEAGGIENIPKDEAIFFVSNHQGTLDPALVVGSCPITMTFISKKQNEKMPVFGSWAKTIDVIHFDRETREGNVYMLRESARRLKSGKSILIFPEGTRSKGDHMNEFKTGAIQPAYLAKATIVPITLNNAYSIDDKKNKNRRLGITYGKPIRFETYKQYKQDEMAEILFKEIEKNIKTPQA